LRSRTEPTVFYGDASYFVSRDRGYCPSCRTSTSEPIEICASLRRAKPVRLRWALRESRWFIQNAKS
jgi:hypothetical protein